MRDTLRQCSNIIDQIDLDISDKTEDSNPRQQEIAETSINANEVVSNLIKDTDGALRTAR